MPRKRVNVPSPNASRLIPSRTSGNVEDIQGHNILPYLSHVTKNCYIDDVDPNHCLPLHLIRGYNENAIARLISILSEREEMKTTLISGLVTGIPTSVVVPLVDEDEHLILKVMRASGLSDEQVQKRLDDFRGECWYGIIDGYQFHAAIMKLSLHIPTEWS